jgi:hypothetical protein
MNAKQNPANTPVAIQCFAANVAAWQLAQVHVARYRATRCYSRHAAELLSFFAMHRTATASQVGRYFWDRFGTERSTRMHLQTLAAQRDLEIVRSRGAGALNIYRITERGLRSVGDETASVPLRRRRPAGSHLAHELLATEVAVLLRQAAKQSPTLQVLWDDRFGLCRFPCFRSLVPDYAFLSRHGQGRLVFLVEVSSGEESTTRLRDKLLSYAVWSDSSESQQFLVDLYRSHGATQPRPHFRLLWVMHNRLGQSDEVRLLQLLQAAADTPPAVRHRMWCTTANTLGTASTLNAPVWLPLHDLAEAFDLAQGGRGRDFHRHLAVAQRSLPRQGLFPSG